MPAARRLAAILATDVAGYSRLMGADEEGTHRRLRAHFAELVEPKIREHRGRTVKNAGDGLLAEFASVVDAVRCAVEVQRGMLDRETEVLDERRIRFRIGINLGDVIAEADDIFGDGVDIAARLEALAEPGGICISRTVREQIRDRLPYPFEDLGEQSGKNIARPVRVYALHPEAISDLPVSGARFAMTRRPRPSAVAIAAAVVAVVVLAIVAWRVWPLAMLSTISPTVATVAPPFSKPLVAPRLSIAVLPFANLSGDPNQQYFADGITEDQTTNLSQIADMFVISRNTAFTYQNKPVDTKQIGHALGVRYVLEGSVERSGNKVRINAQLIDAETDTHLWAEQFERDLGNLLALQREITGRIANTLNLELVTAEAARPTESPDALDYILRGRAVRTRPNSPEVLGQAIGLFERALALDPHSVEAQTRLALASRALDNMSASSASDLARAQELVDQALVASPFYAIAHTVEGDVARARDRCEEAIPEYQTAISLNPNLAWVLHALAACKLATGSIEEVIPIEEQAVRLSPRDANIGTRYWRIGLVNFLQYRTDEAIPWLEKARAANPKMSYFRAALAAAYGLKGESERAAAELSKARKLPGGDRYLSIARLRAAIPNAPKVRALYEATYFAGLRKAGVPEQ